MSGELLYVGLTHQTTPLAIRENVRVDREKLRTLLSRLGGVADGRLVLATCERFEVYATTRHLESASWVAMLSQWFHVPVGLLTPHVRTLRGVEAAEHLLRVAAGLESRIVGEAQILGQVRDAYTTALEMNALDAELSTLGRTAIHTGKRVRSETTLGSGAGSIATVVLDRLQHLAGAYREETPFCPPLVRGDVAVAVVGTGRLAEVVLTELVRRQIGHRVVVGRDAVRVESLALRYGALGASMANLRPVAADVDAMIVCTAAPTYVVDTTVFSGVKHRAMQVFDLSVPRNVDPMVGRIRGVRLTHLDELVPAPEGVNRVASAPRSDQNRALRIVEEELERFVGWRRERGVAEAIAQLVRGARGPDGRALHEHILRLKAQVVA